MNYSEYSPGRLLAANLPHGEDLLGSVAALCRSASIRTGAFWVRGAVSSYTIGALDPRQKVYVTAHVASPGEIVSCSGGVATHDGAAAPTAHVVLADAQGGVTGGRLFSETRVFAGEIHLQEWIGPPPVWAYDEVTGQMLWHFSRECPPNQRPDMDTTGYGHE
jgi:predicted DNA-binding protein with PD1-like motif